jgi:hypothetical protein
MKDLNNSERDAILAAANASLKTIDSNLIIKGVDYLIQKYILDSNKFQNTAFRSEDSDAGEHFTLNKARLQNYLQTDKTKRNVQNKQLLSAYKGVDVITEYPRESPFGKDYNTFKSQSNMFYAIHNVLNEQDTNLQKALHKLIKNVRNTPSYNLLEKSDKKLKLLTKIVGYNLDPISISNTLKKYTLKVKTPESNVKKKVGDIIKSEDDKIIKEILYVKNEELPSEVREKSHEVINTLNDLMKSKLKNANISTLDRTIGIANRGKKVADAKLEFSISSTYVQNDSFNQDNSNEIIIKNGFSKQDIVIFDSYSGTPSQLKEIREKSILETKKLIAEIKKQELLTAEECSQWLKNCDTKIYHYNAKANTYKDVTDEIINHAEQTEDISFILNDSKAKDLFQFLNPIPLSHELNFENLSESDSEDDLCFAPSPSSDALKGQGFKRYLTEDSESKVEKKAKTQNSITFK